MPCVSALISPPIEPTCFYRRKEDDVYRRATCQSEGRLSSSASYFDYDIVTVKRNTILVKHISAHGRSGQTTR
ncbi:hypothetical protein CAJAP_07612 [Camponotus japonicus]